MLDAHSIVGFDRWDRLLVTSLLLVPVYRSRTNLDLIVEALLFDLVCILQLAAASSALLLALDGETRLLCMAAIAHDPLLVLLLGLTREHSSV